MVGFTFLYYILLIMSKISIFLVLLCLLCMYTIYNNSSIYDNFQGKMYRLGDMFRIKKGLNSRYNKKIGFNYHVHNFPNSIATEYMLKTKKSEDYNQLLNIINKRKPKIKINNYVVVHLRIGDVIDLSDKSLKEMLTRYTIYKNGRTNYVKPLSYYNKIINKIRKYKIKNIILIGGYHTKQNHTKSYKYVKIIQKYFKQNGFNCYIRINNDPDDDFLIMCNSNYFVPSGGGFSTIIKNIVNMKGGQVIEI